jgi:MYXO-CTERM domain-containing protein
MSEATPPDTTFDFLASPPGWSCTTPAVGGVGGLECYLPNPPGPLASGATATFTLTVQTQAGTPSGTTITNVVTVDQNVVAAVDPTLTNNRATLDTLIALPTATPTATATATSTATVTGTPTVTPTPTGAVCILGDINCDGIVDIRDYGLWRQAFGQMNCGNPADLDRNCLVDIRDYGIWRQQFGQTAEASAPWAAAPPAGAVPAPRGTPGPALLGSNQAATGSWVPGEPNGSGPAVPVIPLVGGLLGLGGLAGWRRRRPPPRG